MAERKNKGTILWNVPDDEIIDFTVRHEGKSEHLYRDHKGNVTVGYGHMIPNKEKARSINFYDRRYSPLQYASDLSRQKAFDLLLEQPFGKNIPASRYKPDAENKLIDLYLDEPEAKEILRKDLEETAKDARKTFPQLDSYPDSVQRGILDMQFNMGIYKFQREIVENKRKRPGWPNFFDAVEAGDWERAAKESHRKDVQPERNADTYDLFLKGRHD